MTLVMSYVILLAAAVGACAAALDGLLERSTSRRWIWLSSLIAATGATALAMSLPASNAARESSPQSLAHLLSELPQPSLSVTPHRTPIDLVAVTDVILPPAWLVSSAGLLIMIAFGQHRLRRVRVDAQHSTVAGQSALLTDTLGPAVAGLRKPVVLVPKWVLALDEPSQHLLMAHEMEHVRKRDTATLFAGALGAALMPWNPVVWWMVRRLRLAVEQDCDARVLASHPGVRRYADLLLVAASRHRLTTRLLAANFGEHSSDLMRRIDTMTRRQAIVWRRVVPATVIASLLIAGACETPRPAPVAPITVGNEGAREQASFSELEKDKALPDGFSVVVFSSDGKQLARYAGEIPVAHLPKDGVQAVQADERTCGATKCYAVRITLKPGFALDLPTVIDKVPLKGGENPVNVQEFKAAEVVLRGDIVRLLMKDATLKTPGMVWSGPVEVRGETRLDGVGEVANKMRDASAPLLEGMELRKADGPREVRAEGKKLAFTVTRDQSAAGFTDAKTPPPLALRTENRLPEAVDFELLSIGGEVIARYTTDRMPKEIRVDDIEAIEVYKSSSCASGTSCSLIRITLKQGRAGAYRKK